MVIVPMIWVTQLPLALAVGKGGKERGAVPLREPVGALKVLDEDGAVPNGAVDELDGAGREPDRDPVGALKGIEVLDAGNPDEGRLPEREPVGALIGTEVLNAGNPDEGRLPERDPVGALNGTEPVDDGNVEDVDKVPDRRPVDALNGTEPVDDGNPNDGKDTLVAPDGKNEDAPDPIELVFEKREPERERMELVKGGSLRVVSIGNDSV